MRIKPLTESRRSMSFKNCTFIGLNAGADLTSGENIVIIGDDIRSLDTSQSNTLFIGDKLAIGGMLFGEHIDLKEVIEQYQVKCIPR